MLLPPDLVAEHVVDAALFTGRCDPVHHSAVALLITLDPEARALRDTFTARLTTLLDGAIDSATHFEHLSTRGTRSNGARKWNGP